MPERLLTEPPSLWHSYWRALLGAGKPRTAQALPALRAVRHEVLIDSAAVARFRGLLELAGDGPVPPTYAHVLAFPLQLQILTDPAYPLRVPGTVHLRNPIVQQRALRVGEHVSLQVTVGVLRAVPQGVEHDLVTTVYDANGVVIWQGVSTNLQRPEVGGVRGRSPGGTPGEGHEWTRAWPLAVPAAAGRRYAQLSGDWNPIHLSTLSARVFGFRRAIAHGMWTYARVLAALEPHLPGDALQLEVQFRRPLYLPARARIVARPTDAGWEWAVQDRRGTAMHAQGSARAQGGTIIEYSLRKDAND